MHLRGLLRADQPARLGGHPAGRSAPAAGRRDAVSEVVGAALARLGVDRLVCAVHDRCLPSRPDDDIGCGQPASAGADDFLAFLAEAGFNGVQLGPPGVVTPDNVSPYDGSAFARSPLHLAAGPLRDGLHGARLLPATDDAGPPVGPSNRCDYARAFRTQERRLAELHARWDALPGDDPAAARALGERLAAFRAAQGWWLEGDGLHQALAAVPGGHPEATRWADRAIAALFAGGEPDPAALAALRERHAVALERHAREQMLLLEQHALLRDRAHARGLVLQADLQVGLAHGDRWRWASLFLPGVSMGAPPSRTNPEGQPWGYPVLNPAQLGSREAPGPALAFMQRRLTKLFAEYDAVRLDHPHGLVCPWVYESGAPDPFVAVRAGARLFSAGPDAPAAIAAYDIVPAAQLARGRRDPWADDWVTGLTPAQVDRYAVLVDAMVEAAARAGQGPRALVCEVLSTMPAPLGAVLARHGLGRFRVTAKADVRRPDDVYLPASARPADWIMASTHDMPPVWRLAREWPDDVAADRADHAAARLAPDGVGREELAQAFRRSREALAAAELAVLFTSEARHVMVFVSDLLGETGVYNRPGQIHADNWTLRVPSDFRAVHAARCRAGAALDLPAALTLALASLPAAERRAARPVLDALRARATSPLPDLSPRLRDGL
ncbi:MAG: 4-alpha-glucanotransferase, partial [Myxococcales bacterium]